MESQPIFQGTIGVMAVITMIPVFFLWLEKKTQWKVFNYLPAIIWIFLTPIFLSNLDVIPRSTPIYDNYKNWAVPMFIVLMLLDINIRETLKVAWRGIGVLVLGSIGIVVGAAVSFFLFRSGLPENAWSGFGALAGSWIGGTGNLAAVAESLETPGELVGMVVLVDNFVYVLYFPIILSCKRWAKQFNRFSHVSDEQIRHIEQATQEVEKKSHEVHFKDLLTLLGIKLVHRRVGAIAASVLDPIGLPALNGALAQTEYLTCSYLARAVVDGFQDKVEDHFPFLRGVFASSSGHKAWTFFWRMSSAAASANALSLRLRSRSSSRMRLSFFLS